MELSLGRRLFFGGLIVSLSITAALAIGILLFSEFDDTSGRILLTTALVAAFSFVGLPAGVLLDQRRQTWLAWIVIALCVGAFAIAMVLVWGSQGDGDGEGLSKALALFASFAVAAAQIALMTSRRVPADTRTIGVLFWASVVTALAGATMISYAAIAEVDSSGYFRIVGAIVVADLFLVIIQPVARRMAASSARGQVHTFRCVLDRPAGDLPEGFSTVGDRLVVACEVPAAGFAEAVATAIRTLERDETRVVRVERVG